MGRKETDTNQTDKKGVCPSINSINPYQTGEGGGHMARQESKHYFFGTAWRGLTGQMNKDWQGGETSDKKTFFHTYLYILSSPSI